MVAAFHQHLAVDDGVMDARGVLDVARLAAGQVVDEPIPATGRTVFFNFDIRFAPGENSLCIKLMPGESVVRIEMPGAGSVVTQHVPIVEFSFDNVQRVAIGYLRRALQ